MCYFHPAGLPYTNIKDRSPPPTTPPPPPPHPPTGCTTLHVTNISTYITYSH